MKMKVNSQLLKATRNKKCWSQEQLGEISGLSLRTIQRIETKGTASQESIKALAAVLELSCEQIQLIQQEEKITPQAADIKNVNETALIQNEDATNNELTAYKKRYLWGMFAVIAANMIGFLGIYSAYTEQRIDEPTMQLLKNIVSGALLFSTSVLTYKAWKKGALKFEL